MMQQIDLQPIDDHRWQTVTARQRAEGFLIGVLTTGVFCKPGCPARTPLRKNVVVLETPEAAVKAGFRPCLKCKPLGPDAQVADVVALARAIEGAPEQAWTPEEIEGIAGRPARGMKRDFQRILGLTPKAFRDAVRLRRFKDGLKEGLTVTDATYDAGYSGPARRHEAAKSLAMTPQQYARGGAGETIEMIVVDTPIDPMVIAGTERGICVLKFRKTAEEAREAVRSEFPEATIVEAAPNALIHAWAADVVAFLKGMAERPDLPVDLRGTAFQMKVWQALREIPRGQTTTYAALAKKIGHVGASRAVGNANGRNPVAVIVPCHLVVASGGKLGGYAYGLEAKKTLLKLEGADGDAVSGDRLL